MDNIKIIIFYKTQNGELQEIRGSPFTAAHKLGIHPKNNELAGPSMIL